jgi:hypothetical protein
LQSGFTAKTADRMKKCLDGFRGWLRAELQLSLDRVAVSPHTLGLALRGYGLHLFSGGFPRYLLVYAITAVQDLYPEYRSLLAAAWQVDKKWQAAEPGECRPVISLPIIQAASTLALLWRWERWLAITLVGFLCMLHPSEFLVLRRRDLVLPADAMSADRVAYIHIRNPKTARFARRQHCRLEDPLVLRFLESCFGDWPLDRRLYPGTANTYRSQWNAIMGRLGVPFKRDLRGATPGVLRGSGATFLYLETEDLGKVAWRGRWAKLKTIEFYLQEVAAQLLLQNLTATSRDRIALLRAYSRRLLQSRVVSGPL